MKDFPILVQKFREGILWINRALRAGDNPWLRREIARFEREVVGPMDAEWGKMTQEERKRYETAEK